MKDAPEAAQSPAIGFTATGSVFRMLGPAPPDGLPASSTGKVRLDMDEGGVCVGVVQVLAFFDDGVVVAASTKGTVFRAPFSSFARAGRRPRPWFRLDPGDELAEVVVADSDARAVVGTRNGHLFGVHVGSVRPLTGPGRGVEAVRVPVGDNVTTILVEPTGGEFLAVFEDGTGRRMTVDDVFSSSSAAIKSSPSPLTHLHPIVAGLDVVLETRMGRTIRFEPSHVPATGLDGAPVRLFEHWVDDEVTATTNVPAEERHPSAGPPFPPTISSSEVRPSPSRRRRGPSRRRR